MSLQEVLCPSCRGGNSPQALLCQWCSGLMQPLQSGPPSVAASGQTTRKLRGGRIVFAALLTLAVVSISISNYLGQLQRERAIAAAYKPGSRGARVAERLISWGRSVNFTSVYADDSDSRVFVNFLVRDMGSRDRTIRGAQDDIVTVLRSIDESGITYSSVSISSYLSHLAEPVNRGLGPGPGPVPDESQNQGPVLKITEGVITVQYPRETVEMIDWWGFDSTTIYDLADWSDINPMYR